MRMKSTTYSDLSRGAKACSGRLARLRMLGIFSTSSSLGFVFYFDLIFFFWRQPSIQPYWDSTQSFGDRKSFALTFPLSHPIILALKFHFSILDSHNQSQRQIERLNIIYLQQPILNSSFSFIWSSSSPALLITTKLRQTNDHVELVLRYSWISWRLPSRRLISHPRHALRCVPCQA